MDTSASMKQFFQVSKEKPCHIEGDVWLVACRFDASTNSYHPLQRPLDSSVSINEYTRKQLWSEGEDQELLKLVRQKGTRGWGSIARQINKSVHNGLNIRQGRQCRERWLNYVDPDLNKGEWTVLEDQILIEKQKEFGNKWSDIARLLKGRNENSVKNRWKRLNKWKGNSDNSNELWVNTEKVFLLASPRFEYNEDDDEWCQSANQIKAISEGKIEGRPPDDDRFEISTQEEKFDESPSALFLSIY